MRLRLGHAGLPFQRLQLVKLVLREIEALPFDVFMARLFSLNVLELDTTPRAQAVPRLLNAPEKTRVMFEAIVEPVLL
ncbi:MAG: hypothetical protein ACT4O2_12800 [Beijerinckiaceae bacterium]